MYQVTIKGRNLDELKKAVADIHDELTSGKTPVGGSSSVVKDMAQHQEVKPIDVAVEKVDNSPLVPPVKEPAKEDDDLVEVDKEGIPWDERIHSGNKKKTAKGIWQKRKGVDPNVFTTVKAELLAEWSGEERPELTKEEPAQTMSLPTTTPSTPALPKMQNNVHTLASFTENFALVISQLVTEEKITEDYVNQLKQHFGVNEIWEANEESIKATFDLFVNEGVIQTVG